MQVPRFFVYLFHLLSILVRNSIFLVATLALLFASCESKKSDSIRIATSANMQYAIKEIATAFTKKTGVHCEVIIASSGKLAAQIIEGAPFDIFASADLKYPQMVYGKGKAINRPEVYAYGTLILWSKDAIPITSLAMLTEDHIHHIAVANPKTAPYGTAAVEALKHHNIYDQVLTKLVYGESVAQANQFITTKAAQIGFTSKSTVLSKNKTISGNWIEISRDLYSPIEQSCVLLNSNPKKRKTSELFYEYLFSKESKAILKKFGYLVP